MCNRSVTVSSGTGRRRRVRVQPIILNPNLRLSSIDNISSLPTYPSFSDSTGTLTLNYEGNWNNDHRKIINHVCFQRMINSSPTVQNQMDTFRVNVNNGAEVFVATILVNTNSRTIDINKIGTPTSVLPNSSELSAIQSRLNTYNIRFLNWPTSSPDLLSSVLMGINLLTNSELDKIRNLRVRYQADADAEPESGVFGGHYFPQQHLIKIYRSAFRESGERIDFGTLMGIGRSASDLLPSAAVTILHEVAHAISFNGLRTIQDNFQRELRNIQSNWPQHFSELPNGNFQWDDPRAVDSNDRQRYTSDLRTFRNALSERNNWRISNALSSFDPTFQRVRQEPFTPYLRILISRSLRGIDSKQEFFCEGFALYYANRQWLQNCRQPVYEYFNNTNHLNLG